MNVSLKIISVLMWKLLFKSRVKGKRQNVDSSLRSGDDVWGHVASAVTVTFIDRKSSQTSKPFLWKINQHSKKVTCAQI